MRRWLKIKAVILSLAWLIIFLHDAIPHNHNNHPGSECHNLVHNLEPEDGIHIEGTSLNNSHDHHAEIVCHFSSNLFTKHSLDNINIFISESFKAVFQGNSVERVILPAETYYSLSLLPGCLLRAPPSMA